MYSKEAQDIVGTVVDELVVVAKSCVELFWVERTYPCQYVSPSVLLSAVSTTESGPVHDPVQVKDPEPNLVAITTPPIVHSMSAVVRVIVVTGLDAVPESSAVVAVVLKAYLVILAASVAPLKLKT